MSSTQPKEQKYEKKYSQPTIDKNGELTLFYNYAYNRISDLIRLQEKGAKSELRDYFGKNEINHEVFTTDLFSESTYTNLKIYLWKEQKGGRIKFVKPWEKEMINQMLHLLWRLRDYYSHYWHDDSGIVIFNENFRAFLIEKFNIALTSYEARYPFAKKFHNDQPPILINPTTSKFNIEGINFFLSFFLTKSQMELFMNNRERLKMKGVKKETKNSESIKDFDFMRKVNTHYCLSDGHQLNIASIKKEDSLFDEELLKQINNGKTILLDKQSIEILKIETDNYINSMPSYLHNELDLEQKKHQVKRLNNNYLPLLCQFISMNVSKFLIDKNDTRQINWKVIESHTEKRNPIRQVQIEENEEKENKQIPKSYDKIVYEFNNNFGIQFKPDKDDKEKVIQFYNRPYTDKNLTAFELTLNDGSKIRFNVGLKALTRWATMIIGKHTENVVNNLFLFAEEYKLFAEFIRFRTNNFELEKTQLLKLFSQKGGENDKNAFGLQMPKPLLDIYYSIKNNDCIEIPIAELRKNLKTKINNRINVLNELKEKAIETNYHDYKMSAELIKEYNILKSEFNKNRYNFKESIRLEELQSFLKEDQKTEKKLKKIRFKKMKDLLFVMKWILEKSKRFNDPSQKKAVCKYLYLLDDKKAASKFLSSDKMEKSDIEIALYSASEWLTRLGTKEEFQTEDNPQLIETKELQNIFLTIVTSFDDAFDKVIDLAIKKYERLKNDIDKHIETDSKETSAGTPPSEDKVKGRLMWLLQRYRELDIANSSITISANSDMREATKKEVDRINEIITPYTFKFNYVDENNFEEGYIFSLPNSFFDASIDNFKQYFNATKQTHILPFVEDKRKQYQEYFKHNKNTQPYLVSKEDFANKLNKEDYKKANLFYQELVQDAILSLLKEKTFNLQLNKFDINQTRGKDKKVEHTTIDKAKLQTFIPIKLLQRNNGVIHKKHITKMLELLYNQEKQKQQKNKNYIPKTTFDYQTIVQRLQSYHQQSIKCVSEILTTEKEFGESQGWKTIQNNIDILNNPIPQEFEYKKFYEFTDAIEKKYENSFVDIEKQLRNKIFHLDVVERGLRNFLKLKK